MNEYIILYHMRYENITAGIFLSRPNRFIAMVSIDGEPVKAHVKNTGRLGELLVPGVRVYLQDHAASMGTRKLRYSLISVEFQGSVVNIDSQAPNRIAEEALRSGSLLLPGMKTLTRIRPETPFQGSRFDFFLEDEDGKEAFMEVKGCTLNDSGTAKFPDAPTQRGVKHVKELIAATRQGYSAYLLFVCTMKGVSSFEPNRERHPEFADTLNEAVESGVHVLCYDCSVSSDEAVIDEKITVRL